MMSPQWDFQGMHVFIATPCYKSSNHFRYTLALAASVPALIAAGMKLSVHFEPGQSLVIIARSNILTEFLKSEATDLVFIDDDISWNAKDLVRLLGHQVDVVGAPVRRKTDQVWFNVVALDGCGVGKDGLREVRRIGTGMLRISRAAIEKLVEGSPHLKYRDDFGKDRYALFGTGIRDGILVSEDFSFCDLWREHGGKVWCDTEIVVTHWDGQTAYTGKLVS
jgi:hypothetical protein